MSQTVERAISIVRRVARGPATLSEVAAELDVHRSTALRLLQTLTDAGFARRMPDGRYTVGTGLISIAYEALESMDLRDVARPHLTRLNQRCGQTIHLASFVDDDVVYIDKYEGRASVRMYSRVGNTAKLHASGVGKVILANLDPALRDTVISRLTLTRYTANTITSEARFRAELDTIRERGYGYDEGEFEDFVVCIAAPIRSGDGTAHSAVSISVAKMLVPFEELKQLIPDLLETARAVSHDYGWGGE
ncbi:IclR family transcriptional regulator [Actinomadura darangshiensis]|uniref:IclR family transcriptional regulator n=1 Tax=Actinomadura darangshiensis TaxID=705336 RepID=UPI00140D4028|nr:IclR family transcriptional regulator [Actinomadura darangshiensis]